VQIQKIKVLIFYISKKRSLQPTEYHQKYPTFCNPWESCIDAINFKYSDIYVAYSSVNSQQKNVEKTPLESPQKCTSNSTKNGPVDIDLWVDLYVIFYHFLALLLYILVSLHLFNMMAGLLNRYLKCARDSIKNTQNEPVDAELLTDLCTIA